METCLAAGYEIGSKAVAMMGMKDYLLREEAEWMIASLHWRLRPKAWTSLLKSLKTNLGIDMRSLESIVNSRPANPLSS